VLRRIKLLEIKVCAKDNFCYKQLCLLKRPIGPLACSFARKKAVKRKEK